METVPPVAVHVASVIDTVEPSLILPDAENCCVAPVLRLALAGLRDALSVSGGGEVGGAGTW